MSPTAVRVVVGRLPTRVAEVSLAGVLVLAQPLRLTSRAGRVLMSPLATVRVEMRTAIRISVRASLPATTLPMAVGAAEAQAALAAALGALAVQVALGAPAVEVVTTCHGIRFGRCSLQKRW